MPENPEGDTAEMIQSSTLAKWEFLKRPSAHQKNMNFSTNTRLDQLVRNMKSEVTFHSYRNGFACLKFEKSCTGSSLQKSMI